jgi:hypothetical protein
VLRQRSSLSVSVLVLSVVALTAACTTLGPVNTSGPLSSIAPGATLPGASFPGASVPGATLPGEVASGGLPTIAPVVTLVPGVTMAPGEKTPKPGKTPKPTTETTTPTDQPPTAPPAGGRPAGSIDYSEAGGHIGETAWVCGTVAGANWLFDKTGHPTWLNFGNAYPSQAFNAVIWGEQRREWPLNGKPEVVYPGHEICVNGLIEMYQTWPQIQDVSMATLMVIN